MCEVTFFFSVFGPPLGPFFLLCCEISDPATVCDILPDPGTGWDSDADPATVSDNLPDPGTGWVNDADSATVWACDADLGRPLG